MLTGREVEGKGVILGKTPERQVIKDGEVLAALTVAQAAEDVVTLPSKIGIRGLAV